jgi:hypothetical protein
MHTCIRIVALAITLAAPSASAQTPTYLGPGGASCGSWLTERQAKSPLSRIMDGWVLGYLSGSSITEQAMHKDTPDMLHGVDVAGVFAWMDKYCSEHPIDQLASATIQLWSTLRRKALER